MKFKTKALRPLLWAVYLAAVVGFSLSLACERTVVCSYVSVNGDFQSYNVFRRMLAGQTPYLDFANYIGMAPVWLNLPLLALLGGKFSASLFVTNFTANLLFSLSVLVIFYLATRQLPLAMAASALCSKLVSTRLLTVLGAPGQTLDELFTRMYTPSNSMRVARAFLPFLLVVLALLIAKLTKTRPERWLQEPKSAALVGLVMGLFLPWSNDYGLACGATGAVLLVLVCLFRHSLKRLPLCLGGYLAAFALGGAVCAAAVTGGHPGAWWASIRATGGAQYYYFNGCGNTPVLVYLFTCRQFWAWAAALCLYLVPATVGLARGQLSDHGVLLYYAMAAQLCGTLAYLLTGSGFNFQEAIAVYTLLLWLALACAGVLRLLKKQRHFIALGAAGLVCAVGVWLGTGGALALLGHTETPVAGAYIPGLGGYNENTAALVDAAALVQDEPVFSVYATGLETVLGQFQPTGYDYIIHALGEEARAAYTEEFARGEYPWVQTTAFPLENWLTGQNWAFYRQLYRNYRKVFQTEYSWLWQRTEEQTVPLALSEIELSVTPAEDGGVTLTCTADTELDCIVEVKLDYRAEFNSPTSALLCLGRRALTVGSQSFFPDHEAFTSYNLPPEGSGEYVPVVLHGGIGRTGLVGMSRDCMTVTVENARVAGVLPRHELYSLE